MCSELHATPQKSHPMSGKDVAYFSIHYSVRYSGPSLSLFAPRPMSTYHLRQQTVELPHVKPLYKMQSVSITIGHQIHEIACRCLARSVHSCMRHPVRRPLAAHWPPGLIAPVCLPSSKTLLLSSMPLPDGRCSECMQHPSLERAAYGVAPPRHGVRGRVSVLHSREVGVLRAAGWKH